MSLSGGLEIPPRRVLVVVEDHALAEVLVEALAEAGHVAEPLSSPERLRPLLAARAFDAAIVDLDTRARNGGALVSAIRELAPFTTVIALLPCGGLSPDGPRPAYHIAVEKPARLRTLLSALIVAPALCCN
jgi:CheY-like chemotaxis protein